MNPFLPRQAWQYAVGVSWTLVAGLILAPSPAQAQCGHYVRLGARSTNDSVDAQALFENNMGDQSLLVPTTPHKPCSGPGCKQAPSTPPAGPVAPPSIEQKEWGQLPGLFLSPDKELLTLLRDSFCARPFHSVLAIYHPPRPPSAG